MTSTIVSLKQLSAVADPIFNLNPSKKHGPDPLAGGGGGKHNYLTSLVINKTRGKFSATTTLAPSFVIDYNLDPSGALHRIHLLSDGKTLWHTPSRVTTTEYYGHFYDLETGTSWKGNANFYFSEYDSGYYKDKLEWYTLMLNDGKIFLSCVYDDGSIFDPSINFIYDPAKDSYTRIDNPTPYKRIIPLFILEDGNILFYAYHHLPGAGLLYTCFIEYDYKNNIFITLWYDITTLYFTPSITKMIPILGEKYKFLCSVLSYDDPEIWAWPLTYVDIFNQTWDAVEASYLTMSPGIGIFLTSDGNRAYIPGHSAGTDAAGYDTSKARIYDIKNDTYTVIGSSGDYTQYPSLGARLLDGRIISMYRLQGNTNSYNIKIYNSENDSVATLLTTNNWRYRPYGWENFISLNNNSIFFPHLTESSENNSLYISIPSKEELTSFDYLNSTYIKV